MWYGSSQFGMGDEDHGAMNQTEVTDWEVGVSANADTDNWYASLAGAPDGYVWRDGNQWDSNPVAGGGLPVGDITQFGIAWLHTANHHYGAVDNFKWYDSSKVNPPDETPTATECEFTFDLPKGWSMISLLIQILERDLLP